MEAKTADEIINTCPKAFSTLVQFFMAPDDHSTEMQGEAPVVTFTRLMRTMLKNGDNRFLLDFFDSYKLFICPLITDNLTWKFSIRDGAARTIFNEDGFETRSQAEQRGFLLGFQQLEKGL